LKSFEWLYKQGEDLSLDLDNGISLPMICSEVQT